MVLHLDSFEMEITEKYQKRKIPIEFVMTLKNDFQFDSSIVRINEIKSLLNMPENITEMEKNMFLSSLFDFESKFMIQSVGGLLSYLDRKKINFQIDYNLSQTPILSVSKINLDKILLLDSNTFKSLDIFKTVDLNCALRQHDMKKSTSFRTNLYDKSIDTLYGLYSSKILTKIGIKKLRSFMLKPIRDTEVLNERHRFVDFFLKSENSEITKMLRLALKKCKFINNILRDMRIAKCNITEWKRYSIFSVIKS
jgi:DNA mismatch repair ATPase MutS